MSAYLKVLRGWMTRYIMSTFLGLGVLGNLINIYMFTRKDALRSSCSRYLLAASIINIVSLIWGISPSLYTLDNIDPATYSFIYCKLRLYTIHTVLMIGRSLIVFACMDRYALCSQSARLRVFCEPKIVIRLIIGQILVWPLITMHVAFLQNYINNTCFMPGSNDVIYAIYSTIVAGILPPLLMSIFTILTIRHRRALLTRLHAAGSNSKRDNTFIVMLVSQVIIYVIATGLYPTITLYRAITDGQAKTTESLQIESFVNYIGGSVLIYLNPTSPFYIYFIVAKNFRKDCKEAFVRLYRRISGQRSRVEPTVAQMHTLVYTKQNVRV